MFFSFLPSNTQKDRLRSVAVLIGILLLGLLVRMLLAPSAGYEYDIGVNQGWGLSALQLGLVHSYAAQVNGNQLPSYPPFSIMLFEFAAYVCRLLFTANFDVHGLAFRIAIKMPAILADLGTATVLYSMIARWKGRRMGLIAAFIYALHPAVFHDSAFWGQTDSIFTFFLVASLASYVSRRFLVTGVLISLAFLCKPQALLLAPLLLFLSFVCGWKGFLKIAIGFAAATAIILLPFIVTNSTGSVIGVFTHSTGYFAILSSSAYNFWWSTFANSAGSVKDTDLLFHIISYRDAGFLLFGLSYLFVIGALLRPLVLSTKEKRMEISVFVAAAFIALAFFLWNTQMHERYLFPFVALGLPLAFINTRGAVLYGCISFLFYMNLLGWLPAGPIDRAIYHEFPMISIFFATLQVMLFFFLAHFVLLCQQQWKWKSKKTRRNFFWVLWRLMLMPSVSPVRKTHSRH